MKRVVALLVCLFAIGLSSHAQTIGTPVNGQVVNSFGQPVPQAPVRVCSVTASQGPSGCTPTLPIYFDYGLTLPAGNPFSTDQFGNYTFYVPPLSSPNLYTVQVFPATGQMYTYVISGGNGGGSGGATLPTSAIVFGLSPLTSRAATTLDVSTLLQTATGCSTLGNVYSPLSNTCLQAGAGPAAPAFSVQFAATSLLGFQSDFLALNVNPTTHIASGQYFATNRVIENRSDMVDAVADCGAVGDATLTGNVWSGTDNQSAIATCLSAHPFVKLFFPPRYNNGTSDVQAKYFHSGTWNMTAGQHIESTASGYAHGLGAVIASPVGVDSIHINGQADQVKHINIIGSEPASQSYSDIANLILPSGNIATEYQIPINFISTNGSGVTTLYSNIYQAYIPQGIVTITGLPSPYTSLNGLSFYIQSQCPSLFATSCQVANTGWISIYTGLGSSSRTSVSSGTIMPGTTGTSTATGIQVNSSFVQLEDVYVAAFGRNCIEDNGGAIADDLLMTNVQTFACRGQGLWVHGGDSNANVINGYTGYFNGLFGTYDTTFLNGSYMGPQLSYNHGGAIAWSAATPGPAFVLLSCSRNSTNILDCQTSAANPFIVGQGVVITGMSDSSFNAFTVNGLNPVVSCFISNIVSTVEFQCQQPIYQATLSVGTATGGQVQLGSTGQILIGAGMWGGSYWLDGANSLGNIVMTNPYTEGGQGQSDGGCSIFAGQGVIFLGSHFGDCVDINFYPGIYLSSGTSGAFMSPANITPFGNPNYNTELLTHIAFAGGDTNTIISWSDLEGGNPNTPYQAGGEWRVFNPGQNNSFLGMRSTLALDEAGKFNYSLGLGYGGSARSGESAAPGTVTFTGSGLNDLSAGGTITTTSTANYLVTICSTGTPDGYAWQQGSFGPISTLPGGLTVNNPGSGYTVGDVTQMASNDNGNDYANMTITSVNGSGGVTGVVLTFPGLQFIPGSNIPTPGVNFSGTPGIKYGPIKAAGVSTGGNGYNTGDTFSVFQGVAGTSVALGTVTGVTAPGGAVTSFNLTYPGSGGSYSVRTKGTNTITGSGSGLVINITAVSGTSLTMNVLLLKAMTACANILSGANTLSNGLTATWGATTGHTAGNFWTIPINVTFGLNPYVQIFNDLWWGNGTNRENWFTKVSNSAPTGTRPDGTAFARGDVAWNYNPPTGSGTAFWVQDAGGTWQPVVYGSGGGVTSINGTPGAFTFSGSGVSCTSTTCTFTGAGSGIGSITWSIPSWLTATPTTISASGTQTFAAATGQTSHQVIGTCGSATSFAPCALVAGDIPTLNQNTTGTAGGLSGSPAITVSNLTDSALTAGNCVQASTAGLLATTGSPCSTVTITSPNGTIVVGGSTTLDVAGAAGKILAGATPALTFTPQLGVAGVNTGTLALASAGGAGVITLTPAAGAVNATVTIPDATDTLVNLAGTQTLTNKSISGPQINSGIIPNARITLLPLANLATQAADSLVMNASGSTAVPTAVAMPTSGTNGCAGTTNALNYNTTTHTLGCNTSIVASASWSSLTNPTGNLSLTMAANRSTFTYNATTGASDLFSLTDTTGNTGTGIMFHVTTASSSTEIPFQADSNGVGWKVDASGNFASVGATASGQIQISGSTSGTATITVPAIAGTPTITLGSSSGTPAVTASSPLAITTSTGNITCATCVTAATPAAAANQVWVSGGANVTAAAIDLPEVLFLPAAECNNTTASADWSIGSGGTVACRAGTNNLGGYIAITDTSSTFAQFTVAIPFDWDTGTNPYIRFQLAYPGTDGASAHTIIPQIKVACTTATSGVSDDPTFQAAHSSSTITLSSATANLFFSTSNVQMNATDVTGCVAGGLMIVQVGRATDTATSAANFFGATLTFPRKIVVQAN